MILGPVGSVYRLNLGTCAIMVQENVVLCIILSLRVNTDILIEA